MPTLADYAVSQRCEGFDDYFSKRAELLRSGTRREQIKAKTPAIASFIRKKAEEKCDSGESKDEKSKDEKSKDEKSESKDKKKRTPPWMDGEEKEAKAELGTGTRFKSLVKDLKRKDMKDGKKDIENPYALAAAIGRKTHGKQKFQAMAAKGRSKKSSVSDYAHLAHFMEKRAYGGAMIQPDPATHEILRSGVSGATRGGLAGAGLGGLLGAGLGAYAAGQGDFDDLGPLGGAAAGALGGGLYGGLGGGLLGGLGGSGYEWARQLAGGDVPKEAPKSKDKKKKE